jgi:hypothetical protein
MRHDRNVLDFSISARASAKCRISEMCFHLEDTWTLQSNPFIEELFLNLYKTFEDEANMNDVSRRASGLGVCDKPIRARDERLTSLWCTKLYPQHSDTRSYCRSQKSRRLCIPLLYKKETLIV